MRTPEDLPNTNPANTDYAHGRLRDDTVKGDGTGTPVRADYISDIYYGHLETIDRAGIVINHDPDNSTSNQFADAIETLIEDAVDSNIVDNAHLTDMPANTIKGNDTGSAGDPKDLTTAEVKVLLALDNVTNESKATMFTSPVLTGTPEAPTASASADTTQIATTEFTHDAIALDTDYLADFREWDATRVYAANSPVFFNGDPYKPNPATLPFPGDSPLTHPDRWLSVGRNGAELGNICPSPAGATLVGWESMNFATSTVTSLTTTLTGYPTEIRGTISGSGGFRLVVNIPTYLRSSIVEITFDGHMNSVGAYMLLQFLDSADLPYSTVSNGFPTITGKFRYTARIRTTSDSTLKIRVNGPNSIDVRFTNIYIGPPRTVIPIKVTGTKTTSQSLTANVTNITFVETYDPHGLYDGTTFTVPITGWYRVRMGPFNSGPSAGHIAAYINGTVSPNHAVAIFSAGNTAGIYDIKLNAGEALTFRFSISQNVAGNATYPAQLDITYIGDF
jgi:hypothetical protein